MATLRCKDSFAAFVKGVPRVVSGGQLVDSSDPVVKGREKYFEAVDAFMERRRPQVEQATAEPGEVRQVSKPKKTAKTAAKSASAGKPKDDG